MQEIVSFLKQPPFNLNLTLVSLDQKSFGDLLQLLNDVFAQLDENQKCKLLNEPPETTKRRFLEFLTLLGFKPKRTRAIFSDNDCKRIFEQFDRSLILEILSWCLSKFETLKQRVYVGQFLKPVDVPTEFLTTPKLADLLKTLKDLQSKFKDSHKNLLKTRRGMEAGVTAQLKTEIKQLKGEKIQLMNKLRKLRAKKESGEITSKENFDVILEATSRLRKNQEEEALVFQRIDDQQRILENSREYHAQLLNRCKQLQLIEEQNEEPQEVLQKLRSNVEETQEILRQYEQATIAKAQHVQNIEEAINAGPVQEQDLMFLQEEVERIEHEIQNLLQKRDEIMDSRGDEVSIYRTLLKGTVKKQMEAAETQEELVLDKKELLEELRKLEKEIASSHKGKIRPMTDTEVRNYMDDLREKSKQYEHLRNKIVALRDEVQVLTNTKRILCGNNESMLSKKLELEENPIDPEDERAKLSELSNQNANINQNKQQTLDQTAAVVKEINEKLKANKSRLAPLLQHLKAKREQVMQLEEIFVDKKRGYEEECFRLNSETKSIEHELKSLEDVCCSVKRQTKLMEYKYKVKQTFLEKLNNEHGYKKGQGRLNPRFATYGEWYDQHLTDLTHKLGSIRKMQKELEHSQNKNLCQREYFVKLKELLTLQIDERKSQVKELKENATLQKTGEDRLIL